jgi:succinoglycan biosynthesis protein ExoA
VSIVINVSVIITSFKDEKYLGLLLEDLSKQTIDPEKIEILLLRASPYSEKKARERLGKFANSLKYWFKPKLNRTKSLNFLIRNSLGKYIFRLDARSHIDKDYISSLLAMHSENKYANIGGYKQPIGTNPNQEKIANLMQHPFCFGGGLFRKKGITTSVKTVYLGSFNKFLMPKGDWYDETFYMISEDTDLNLRILENNERILLAGNICVQYYARDNLNQFFKLCYNYGLGRGLYIIKNNSFLEWRQVVPPTIVVLAFTLMSISFIDPFYFYLLCLFLFFYFFGVVFSSIQIKRKFHLNTRFIKDTFFYCRGFIGCHIFWILGFFASLYQYNLFKKGN